MSRQGSTLSAPRKQLPSASSSPPATLPLHWRRNVAYSHTQHGTPSLALQDELSHVSFELRIHEVDMQAPYHSQASGTKVVLLPVSPQFAEQGTFRFLVVGAKCFVQAVSKKGKHDHR